MTTTPAEDTAETSVSKPRINTAQYREISTFDQALALAEQQYGNVDAASAAIGDGFELLTTDQKLQLVGVPLILLSWSFSTGDHGEFVSARAVTKDNRKVVLNDGSSGIYQQLRDYTDATGRDGGLGVARGLRMSRYDYTVTEGKDAGKTKEAVTYYIDTAA